MSEGREHIHPDLANVALEKAEGFAFERFAQDFLSVLEGRHFVPMGGQKDGGADGLYDSGDGRIFYQFTRQENHREKIRKTHARLLEVGRKPKTIYYLSARLIPHTDKEEDLLTEELGVIIKIRDRKYILSHINNSKGTIAAYENHLAVYTRFLEQIARSKIPGGSPSVNDPSAFVFLQHEVTNRLGNRKLVHSVTDTMILWALSDTDPDKNIFMTEDQISSRIFESFPWTIKLLKGHIRQRLEALRKKQIEGREVRWYKNGDKYCLPYDTRKAIREENQYDESLKIQFLEELEVLASDMFDGDDGEYQLLAAISDKVVQLVFERQGLLFSHFLSSDGKEDAPLVVTDCIDEVLSNGAVPSDKLELYRDYVESLVREVFYHGSRCQKDYLLSLSRTYVLLFSLQAEPRIVEYFSTMSSQFRLFLGSDILVKALSERYLDQDDQVARNLLKIASNAGISMYLSECVLEEVFTHIRGTNLEFVNHFSEMEPYITREIARNSDKILIRSYFYAKEEGKVRGWKSYIGQFITYENTSNNQGRDELKRYLVSEYNLTFIENEDLESVCNNDSVKTLAAGLSESMDKKNESLAYNAALLVHGIYGLRRRGKETASASEYGLKTWWMTNQSRVLKHTAELVRKNHSKYIMRPEYILNFIAMSPSCEDIRRSFRNIFPSNFGIQLGHRLKEGVFRQVMADVKQWKEYEPGRITALMSDLSDKLKSDRLKRYEHTLSDDSL